MIQCNGLRCTNELETRLDTGSGLCMFCRYESSVENTVYDKNLKHCKNCFKVKPVNEFYLVSKETNYRSTYCKNCTKSRNAQRLTAKKLDGRWICDECGFYNTDNRQRIDCKSCKAMRYKHSGAQCRKCLNDFPLSGFQKDRSRKHEISSYCLACHKMYKANY